MRWRNIWWYEELIAMPDVPEYVIQFFGEKFPPSSPNGQLSLPASVCVRLFLRHFKHHTEITTDTLEMLGFIHGLVTTYPEQFSSSCNFQALMPHPELTSLIMYKTFLLKIKEYLADVETLSRDEYAKTVDALIQSPSVAGLLTQEYLATRRQALLDVFDSTDGHDIINALEIRLPVSEVAEGLQSYTEQAWLALGPTQLQVAEEDWMNGKYTPTILSFGRFNSPELQGEVDKKSNGKGAQKKPASEPPSAKRPARKRRKNVRVSDEEAGAAGALLSINQAMPAGSSHAGVVVQLNNESAELASMARGPGAQSPVQPSPQPTAPAPLVAPPKARKHRAKQWDSPGAPTLKEEEETPAPSARRVVAIGSARRRVGRWTTEETDLFIQLTMQNGKGRWKHVLAAAKGRLAGRTQVDLKDKWRNLEKQGLVPRGLPSLAQAGPQELPLLQLTLGAEHATPAAGVAEAIDPSQQAGPSEPAAAVKAPEALPLPDSDPTSAHGEPGPSGVAEGLREDVPAIADQLHNEEQHPVQGQGASETQPGGDLPASYNVDPSSKGE